MGEMTLTELRARLNEVKGEQERLRRQCDGIVDTLSQLDDELKGLPSKLVKDTETERKRQEDTYAEGRRKKIECLDKVCATKIEQARELVNSYTENKEVKEFAGKMEVEELDTALSNFYPSKLMASYQGATDRQLSGQEAYALYVDVAKRVNGLSTVRLSSLLFSGVNKILHTLTDGRDTMADKILIGICGASLSLFYLQPFLFIGLLASIGVSGLAYGVYVRSILVDTYAIKKFLSDEYDQDLFDSDSAKLMESVSGFIECAKQEYVDEICKEEFILDSTPIQKLEEESKAKQADLSKRIADLEAELEGKRSEVFSFNTEIQELNQSIEDLTVNIKELAFTRVHPISSWLKSIVWDVGLDGSIKEVENIKGNSLFVSSSLEHLQQFAQLYVHQTLLQVYPTYVGQIYLDYRYMGGKVLPYTRLNKLAFQLESTSEGANNFIEKASLSMQMRCEKILATCGGIDEFNDLIKGLGGNGEPYTIIHVFGLSSLSQQYHAILTNGIKVGIFFKFYLTLEEVKVLAKDLPMKQFKQMLLVSDSVKPISVEQLSGMVQ